MSTRQTKFCFSQSMYSVTNFNTHRTKLINDGNRSGTGQLKNSGIPLTLGTILQLKLTGAGE
uniref:Uncharacterized protein n=1 Tax=Oryza brachyantha TaxID=4533 RepID=J3KU44_ORYBR